MPKAPTFNVLHFPEKRSKKKFRVAYLGRQYWFQSMGEAEEQVSLWKQGRRTPTMREIEEINYYRELLEGTPLLTAVRFYIAHNGTVDGTMTVTEAVDLHEAAVLGGRQKYQTEKKRHLMMLRGSFGPMKLVDLTRHVIEEHFRKIKSDWVHDAFLRHAKQFFTWACNSDLCTVNAASRLKERKPKGSKIILSLRDSSRLLELAKSKYPTAVVPLVLQMFAGIRTAELCRPYSKETGERPLEWSDIRAGRAISIEAAAAKTDQRRVIDWWPEALTHWLPDLLPAKGMVAVGYSSSKKRLIARAKKLYPDFRWGSNALRHSYATYGCAYFQSAARVALQLGHRSEDVLFTSYREYATKAEAEVFFGGLRESAVVDVKAG